MGKRILVLLFLALQIFLFSRLVSESWFNPPPVDSLHLIAPGVGFGGSWYSPQYYPHAKHIVNVKVGSYYFPVVIWKEDNSWNNQLVFSYWDNQFQFWSYPDSFSRGGGGNGGSGNVWADRRGNLHFTWHESGNPDGYEIFYTRANFDTTAGMIQYTVETHATLISSMNGENEIYPSMAIYEDTVIVIVFTVGNTDEKHAIGYNMSKDGGDTWLGPGIAYEHGGIIPEYLMYPSIAPDPTCGDMWVSLSFDDGGTQATDIVALYYDIEGDTWTKEVVAISPYDPDSGMYTLYSLPVICVDNSGIPSIAFEVLFGGAWVQPPIWKFDGILLFTHRVGGTWISPVEVGIPESGPTNAISGYPSIGVTSDNDIYVVSTQPESANPDTVPFFPFNVYCWKIDPDQGVYSVQRTKVSEVSGGDSVLAVFPHIIYEIPGDSSDGPGITWCQMRNGYFGYVPPSDIYYKRFHHITGIEDEGEKKSVIRNCALKIFPNPFREKTEIRLVGLSDYQNIRLSEIRIYDLSGRVVRNFEISNFQFPISVEWRGEDDLGRKVCPGVYFMRVIFGKRWESEKVILLE